MTQNELISLAQSALNDLISLIQDENAALRDRKMEQVRNLVKDKQPLAERVEKLLVNVKQQQDEGADFAHTDLKSLQQSLNLYQQAARQNMLLLRAAHETTADFLQLVKQTLAAQKPNANTYSKQGQMTDRTSSDTPLVQKAV